MPAPAPVYRAREAIAAALASRASGRSAVGAGSSSARAPAPRAGTHQRTLWSNIMVERSGPRELRVARARPAHAENITLTDERYLSDTKSCCDVEFDTEPLDVDGAVSEL